MKLIVGLGNPDAKYQSTRHNLGANVILSLAENLNQKLTPNSKLSASIFIQQPNFILAIPGTYMNESGLAVAKVANYYKIAPENLWVIHDDLDLAVGEYRLQFDRGPAGHNGIKSIIDHLGTRAFNRIRIGIDHPRDSQNPNLPVEDYVLLPFTPEEKVIIAATIDKILPEVEKLLGH